MVNFTMTWQRSGFAAAASLILIPLFGACAPLFVSAQATESMSVLNGSGASVATLSVPRAGIQPSEVAVLVNDHDPQSVEVANYYQQKRGIPSQNMIHVNFDETKIYSPFTKNNGLDETVFAGLKTQVEAAAGPNIQAYAISWSNPFRLASWNYYTHNYSITSAFAFGVNPAYLEIDFCNAMPVSSYYDTNTTKPYTDFGVRPSMVLAGTSAANAKAMIDKAVLADKTFPAGNGWFVRTSDTARSNPRYADFQSTVQSWNRPEALAMNYYDYYSNGGNNMLQNQSNVLFYETGIAWPTNITSNTYVPGAVADHLTSEGGDIFGTNQMSILRWLEAGASGSYGTVIEPCNYLTEKFPRASVLVKNYFRGNTLVEAYQKSVKQPAMGLLVGDPLTRPFGTKATLVNGTLTITTTSLEPGTNYAVYSAPSASGPFTQVATVSVSSYQKKVITIPGMTAPYYKLENTAAPAPTPTPTPTPAPTATLSASPASVTAGQSSTLTWSSTNATSCTGSGFTASGTSGSVSVTPSVTTTYSITCTGSGGTSSPASASVAVAASGSGITATLTASPTSISTAGQTVSLTWGSTNAVECVGTGFNTGFAKSGSTADSPSVTTTYSVTCTGSGGTSASASATVTVNAPTPNPTPTATLSASPASITAGQSSTLSWSSANATSCTGSGFTASGTSGSVSVTPSVTTTYSVTCTGAGGTSAPTNATVTVNAAASAPTASLSASPSTIAAGQSSTLTWSSTNATSCTGSGFTASGTSGSVSVTPSVTTTYSITCTGSGGTSSPASASVTVTASGSGITATLTASPTSISTVGQTVNLTWGSTNAVECEGFGFNTGWTKSGSTAVSPDVTTTYSVTCYGSGGASASASATITVGSGAGAAAAMVASQLSSLLAQLQQALALLTNL